jgi:nucleotide-binding universal stress UspA family protein
MAMRANHEDDLTRRGAPETAEMGVDPMTSLDKHIIEAAALRQAEERPGEIMEVRRKGKVEAEAHRLSEEMTRAAQERQRVAATPATGLAEDMPALSSPALAVSPVPSVPPGGVLPEMMQPRRPTPPLPQLRSLVVPLDGTPGAERALPFAAALATALGAHLTLAHVLGPHGRYPGAVLDRILEHIVVDVVPSDAEDDMPRYLESLRQRVAPHVPDSKALLISASSVEAGLLALAKRGEADVLALASSQHDEGASQIFGHVVARLIQHGHTPMLLIPPRTPLPAEQAPSIARVLVPLDGSQLAEAALPMVGALLRGGRVREVALLNAEETFIAHPAGKAYLRDIRRMLLDMVPSGDATITTTITPGAASSTIVAASEGRFDGRTDPAQSFDLIVMATHGRGGLGRWLFGSVAEYVVGNAARPVLLVHPGEPDEH